MIVKLITSNGTAEVEEAEPVPFASLPLGNKGKARETDLEQLLSENVWIIVDPEEDDKTMLVIGRQVKTSSGKVMDLVAIDKTGALILIEVKRDLIDIKARKDNSEIQAVRYAASLATLTSADELVVKVYAPYIERFRETERQAEAGGRSAVEWARKQLDTFIETNGIPVERINHTQKIVLIGAGFDDDTKSAAAWMARNNLPIRVIEVRPYRIGAEHMVDVQQIIPPPNSDQYFVDLTATKSSSRSRSADGSGRSYRPRISALLRAGKIRANDVIYFKGKENETATITQDGHCLFRGKSMSLLAFGKLMSGWSAVNVYDWLQHKPSGKLLGQLRDEMEGIEGNGSNLDTSED
jgi:hypothetical protein